MPTRISRAVWLGVLAAGSGAAAAAYLYKQRKRWYSNRFFTDPPAPPFGDENQIIETAGHVIPQPTPSPFDTGGLTVECQHDLIPKKRNAAGDTHVGLRRENNEDAFLCDPKRGLFAVLDGMGAMAAGEEASQIARDALDAFFSADKIAELRGTDNDDAVEQALRDGLNEANQRILDDVRENPFNKGMGAAAVVALLIGNRLRVANLGDCRAYRVGSDTIEQITRDQTMAAFLMEHGELTPEEARRHPSRNELLSALGDRGPLTPVIAAPHPLSPDEKLLLCSDGLWDMLSDDEIAHTARTVSCLAEAVAELIINANEPPGGQSGGKDNITVVLVGEESEEATTTK